MTISFEIKSYFVNFSFYFFISIVSLVFVLTITLTLFQTIVLHHLCFSCNCGFRSFVLLGHFLGLQQCHVLSPFHISVSLYLIHSVHFTRLRSYFFAVPQPHILSFSSRRWHYSNYPNSTSECEVADHNHQAAPNSYFIPSFNSTFLHSFSCSRNLYLQDVCNL